MDQSIVDIAIVGGGLSGLALGYQLRKTKQNFLIFEASDRLGGRIHSIRSDSGTVLADLGPTWVWPQFQPSVLEWVSELGLNLHAQYETGLGVYEDGSGGPVQKLNFPGQQGIKRISGGPQAIIDCLAEAIPVDNIKTASPISRISRDDDTYRLDVCNGNGRKILAKRIVLACPLRIAGAIDGVRSLLPSDIAAFIASVPTWMATHAKASIVYDAPFWRDEGLSGRVASRVGPLVEMHDISGENGSPAALFGFCGIPALKREQIDLEAAILDQLRRCLGERGGKPVQFEIMDWAKQPFICSPADLSGDLSHPQRLPDAIRFGFQDETLFLGVSETAEHDPGLIAGALDTSKRVASQLTRQ